METIALEAYIRRQRGYREGLAVMRAEQKDVP